MISINSIAHRLVNNRFWKSIVRYGYPDSDLNRSQVIADTFLLHLHSVKVKRHSLKLTYTFGLGLISFFLFVILVGTGGILMFFYVPSVEQAYTDIQNLETGVAFGLLLRNIHRWAAHLMVAAVFLHMCRVFFTGSYKRPREFNWVIGVLLWVITLLLSYTGYLLPWDQLSYWAVTVGTNMVGAAWSPGEFIRVFLLGGKEVGQEALLRFYVLHNIVLPVAMTVLLGLHFWRTRKDGGLSSPDEREETKA